MSHKSALLELVRQIKLALLQDMPPARGTPKIIKPQTSPEKKAVQVPLPSERTEKAVISSKPAPLPSHPRKREKEPLSLVQKEKLASPYLKDRSDILSLFKKCSPALPLCKEPLSDFPAKEISSAWKKEALTVFFLVGSQNDDERLFFEKVAEAASAKLVLAKVVTELPASMPPSLERIFYTPSVKIEPAGLPVAAYRLEEALAYQKCIEKKKTLWRELKDLL